MTVLFDTSVLVAFLDRDDANHLAAERIVERALTGQQGLPASTDYVLDEGLTLLRRRPGRREVSEAFASLFLGPWQAEQRPFEMWTTDARLVREAAALHFQYYDRKLSFTDCTLLAHAARCGGAIATFDRGFEGLATTFAT